MLPLRYTSLLSSSSFRMSTPSQSEDSSFTGVVTDKDKRKRSLRRYTKDDWDNIYALASRDELDLIPVDILVHNYDRLKKIAISNKKIPPRLEWSSTPVNEWHYGPTGSGKTASIFSKKNISAEEIFRVNHQNSVVSFDGYKDEPYLLIDDFTLNSYGLRLHDLLQIGDVYPFSICCDFGRYSIRPKAVFITSNLSPQQMFPVREYSIDGINAVLRRYRLIEHKYCVSSPTLPNNLPLVCAQTNSEWFFKSWFGSSSQ